MPGEAGEAAPAQDQTGSAELGQLTIQEVTVTARKREESLQQVPLSVVAISAQELEQRSIGNLSDLGQSTPNFKFAETPQNGRVGGVIFIRGVGQRDTISAYDPAVGLYIDGVYMGRMWGNNLDMLEIERVEVLRGPQGTLFGKNTSGGAISIATRQPDASSGSPTGRVQLTGGSRNRFDALGSVNIPLVADRLALQVAGSRLKQDGYGHRIDGQDMANTDRLAARAQLLFEPTDSFSALLAGDWMDFDETNASLRLVDTNPGIGPLLALNAVIDPDYDDRWRPADDYFNSGTGPNSARGRLRGASLVLTYELGPATLKSISAYRDLDVHNEQDPDSSPIVVLDQFQEVHQQQVSQELQASGSTFGKWLDWVVGAYYFREAIEQSESYNVLTARFGTAANFARRSPIDNDSIAFFAQGTANLTERLRLTAGLRYTDDEKTIRSTQFNGAGAVAFTTPTGRHSSNAVSPRLGLDYQWTPQAMIYVSAAQGAKNGGFNGRVSRLTDFTEFDDEQVWTYEAGWRSDLFAEHVRFNATAFYSRYEDLQLQISGSTVVNSAPVPFNIITNIPRATVQGGEVELILAPARGLTFSGGLGLAYGKYTQLPNDPQFVAAQVITRDSKFSHAPEVSFTLGAEYTRTLGGGVTITPRIDYAHQGRIYYNVENTASVIQPAYGLLNARLTFETPRGLALSLFGTNLTDESYIVGGFDDAATRNPGLGFSIVTQGAPRTLGVSAQMRL